MNRPGATPSRPRHAGATCRRVVASSRWGRDAGERLTPILNTSVGTRERKRAAKAAPPRLDVASPGCIGAFAVYLLLCTALYWAGRSTWSLALAAPAVLLLIVTVTNEVRGLILLAESRRHFAPLGIRCVVVYSNSSVWEAHIRTSWLPRLGACATTLNWSERSSWRRTLEVRLFRQFIETSGHNFNPAVLVLRGLRRPHVYRFYYAFQQSKHGRAQYLEGLEAEMFSELEA